MNLILQKTTINFREIGFPPNVLSFSGNFSSYWNVSETLREDVKFRLAVVDHVGEAVTKVKPGDIVCYHALSVMNGFFPGSKNTLEDYLAGIYTGIVLGKNDYTIDMEKFSFTPLLDRIVVKADQEAPQVIGKVDFGDAIQNPYKKGTVVRSGEDANFCTEGKRVMFGPTSGLKLELPEGEFLLLRQTEIYGIIENEEDEK